MKSSTRRALSISSLIVAACVLSACGSATNGSRTATTAAPTSVTSVVAAPSGVASTSVAYGTAVAPPATTVSPDLTPPPTPTARPENSTPSAQLADVTLADNGATIRMHIGQSFLLNLGSDGWTVTVADQTIVSRVINIAVVRGAQGVYLAHAAGQTTLDATGPTLPCQNAVPRCLPPVQVFRVTIVVTL